MESGKLWQLSQCFGGDQDPAAEVAQADIVSACAFDCSGKYLAAGDHGGRVVVWQQEMGKPKPRRNGTACPSEFKFYCEFQSHDPEFDVLKSTEIEERIGQLKWLYRPSDAKFLFSSNDKTIKVWKIYDKDFKELTETPDAAVVPRLQTVERATVAKPKGIFANGHPGHINSVSPCSDGTSFLSADENRVHIWDINCPQRAANVLEFKAPVPETEETITTALFHERNCYEFVYATSMGVVTLCDTRRTLDCSQPARVFRYNEPHRTIFTELISSVASVAFRAPDYNHVVARDYMSLKVWDLRMNRDPLIIRVHDEFRGKLAELYDHDYIFDKFDCCCSPDGSNVLTGSYGNRFRIFSLRGEPMLNLDAVSHSRRKKGTKKQVPEGTSPTQPAPPQVDFSKKGLHVAWHPKFNVVALCNSNNLFIYFESIRPDEGSSSPMQVDRSDSTV
eukprot:c9754_g1_i1.p1 GENE.c9754_g1_i1~~c9754_g1_i1.p1  ORF type:complete len:448 (+),score=67.63 c9754_g1_i1:102-1445(+)